ncbi:MAG: formylmethanofuran dehydrogenase [Chloroflexi bacterium]|nr:MAG: formylmethanofuran dehydrogenase [Chloroflexota bacterium]
MIQQPTLTDLLEVSAAQHKHLCPRQVLGVRMGMLAGDVLGINLPQSDKRLLAFVETDGCFADGISAATGCYLGRRTLRLFDYGKVAATFIDTLTREAIRITPRADIRQRARHYAQDARSRWHAQLAGYQVMPDDELLDIQYVTLNVSLEQLISRPGRRVACDSCGEEIINEREVCADGRVLCRPCAGDSYYAINGL